ncbi:response regulator [Deferribacter autotrophicus]|uniref:histidine kinase n=1 Tax=Deferribacter autotrophicus TaxID=500465 RepID=A0A5A8F4E7_9BACT|nr:ATP-binding protein [Deferribacter autotrophicus]KAA0257430.1 response regulator [Deferribacter autotrophicus]
MNNKETRDILSKLGFIYYEGFIENDAVCITYVSDEVLNYISDKSLAYSKNFFKEILTANHKDAFDYFTEKAKKEKYLELLYQIEINNQKYWVIDFTFFEHKDDKILFYGYFKGITRLFDNFIEKKEISEYASNIYSFITKLLEKDEVNELDIIENLIEIFKFEKLAIIKFEDNNPKLCLHNLYEHDAKEIIKLLDSKKVKNENYKLFNLSDNYIIALPNNECKKIVEERFKTVLKILNLVVDYSNKRKRLKKSINNNLKLIDQLKINYAFLEHILNNLQSGVCVVDELKNVVLSNYVFNKFFKEDDIYDLLGNNNSILSRDDNYFKIYIKDLNIENETYKMILAVNVTDIVKYEQEISRLDRLAAIGQLTAGIAHDFNNVLTGIMGMSNALKMLEKDSKKLNFLENIEKLVDKAAGVIRQLLDFARQSEGTGQFLDLVPFIKEFTKILSNTFPKKIKINFKYNKDEKYVVFVDPVQLDRILMNICVNAKDAIGDNQGEINIALEKIEIKDRNFKDLINLVINGKYICISISDSGEGIPKNIRKKIFDPYFTTKVYGNGLGLAQVYGLVKNNNGYITFESELGKGTTFYILLPEVNSKDEHKEEIKKSEKIENLLKDRKILIIDDEKYIIEPLIMYLENYGAKIDYATSGTEGINLAEKNTYDVIITDYYLPDVDSLELLAKFKNVCKNIIVISGYPVKNMDLPFLKKPFALDKLRDLIIELVKNK